MIFHFLNGVRKEKKKMEKVKETETEKKKKKQGEKEVFQFYIYKLPIDRPAAVTGSNIEVLLIVVKVVNTLRYYQ